MVFEAALRRAMQGGAGGADASDAAGALSATGFLGVTRHKRTQRFEAHIWIDKKQIYLGAYHSAVQAARGHDVMALRCKGEDAALNFAPEDYEGVAPLLGDLAQSEVVTALRTFSKSLSSANRAARRPAGSAAVAAVRRPTGAAAAAAVAAARRPPVDESPPTPERRRKRKQQMPTASQAADDLKHQLDLQRSGSINSPDLLPPPAQLAAAGAAAQRGGRPPPRAAAARARAARVAAAEAEAAEQQQQPGRAADLTAARLQLVASLVPRDRPPPGPVRGSARAPSAGQHPNHDRYHPDHQEAMTPRTTAAAHLQFLSAALMPGGDSLTPAVARRAAQELQSIHDALKNSGGGSTAASSGAGATSNGAVAAVPEPVPVPEAPVPEAPEQAPEAPGSSAQPPDSEAPGPSAQPPASEAPGSSAQPPASEAPGPSSGVPTPDAVTEEITPGGDAPSSDV